MIKTKACSCKGVNSEKNPQNMPAGYEYNPALQCHTPKQKKNKNYLR